ncbi:MAG: Hpt domain-containing protein [Ideonella sp.]|nr:Hpt domain-containing protein [Ideonella sp.]
MDRARADNPSEIDLSALAWVHEELRRSLEAAHKGLRRFVKEYQTVFDSDVDAVDPAVLRGVRQQLHQSVGALELVGLPAAAKVLRASEALVQRFVAKPKRITEEVADAIESASFALLDYLARLLAGKSVSALAMFPQYRAVQEVSGVERVHPCDLWPQEWRWLALPADATAAPLVADARQRIALEEQLLTLMRASAAPERQRAVFGRISDLCAGLGAGATQAHAATLWKLAAAMFEAQQQGLLEPDVFTKRVASRLLPQFRQLETGAGEVSDRLAHELLFFCAQAASPGAGHAAPRLAAVRQAYGLAHHVPADYNVSVLGRFDPALIAQARKRVASAKEAWGAVAGGEVHRLTGLAEQFALVGDSLRRLYPDGKLLADELQTTVTEIQHVAAAPPAPLAMELATSLLYLEASLEDGDFENPLQGERVRRFAERMAAVRGGAAPDALEGWMEELYRRVSDRQTLGSVVHELRASLSESESLIDQYFRNPADTQALTAVPAQLSAMRGVLSVLGLDQASQAVLRMRDDVDALLTTEVDPARAAQTGTFDRLAGNLGALGFLIDMFSVQPQMAKSLFAFDAERGTLDPLMGRPHPAVTLGEPAPAPVEPRLIEQAQSLAFSSARPDVPVADLTRDLELLSSQARASAQPELVATVESAQTALDAARDDAERAAAREQLSEALVDFVHTSSGMTPLEPEVSVQRPATPAAAGELDQDDEMREVFLEEAHEVLADAREALKALADAPAELEYLISLRRAFHTLKGSSRMVGLDEFGAAAWAGEQVYNTRLAEQRPADAPLLAFTESALAELGAWVDALAGGTTTEHFKAATVQAAAEAMATPPVTILPAWSETTTEPADAASTPLEGAAAPGRGESVVLPPDLPSADELDFTLDLGDADLPADLSVALVPDLQSLPEVVEAAAQPPAEAITPLDFELDLRRLDAKEAPAPTPAPEAAPEPAPAFDMFATLPYAHGTLEQEVPASPVPDVEAKVDLASPAEQLPDVAEHVAEFDAAPDLPVPFTDEEQEKRVGHLRIGIPLFNIYLNEADELSRRLGTLLAEWAMELHRPVGEDAAALAHSLAGSSATVGFADLSQLARALEHALLRAQTRNHGDADEAALYVEVSDEIRQLLHQFAAGFLKTPRPGLLERLAATEIEVDRRQQAETEPVVQPEPEREVLAPPALEQPETGTAAAVAPLPDHGALAPPDSHFGGFGLTELKPLADLAEPAPGAALPVRDARDGFDDGDEGIDAIDAVDAELFPIFEEEGQELLPQLAACLRDWLRRPADQAAPAAAMRTLHTLKGGARLAGAMRLGEMCHRLESRIEHLLASAPADSADLEALQTRGDALLAAFEALRSRDAQAYAAATEAALLAVHDAQVATPAIEPEGFEPAPEPEAAAMPDAGPDAEPDADAAVAAPESVAAAPEAPAIELPEIDWSRFADDESALPAAAEQAASATPAASAAVRVRAPLLDRMVNQAGEVSITRTRIESEVGLIRSSLNDLAENLERLRQQLRELELQGETQMSSRLEAAKAAAESFDPLEFDRFTRFQELTRMMAESVNDVATVQRTLQRAVEATEDELAAQTRLTRDLQDDLLRTRMVEFESQADRLYRVVRQAAKETGKQVRLDIVGGAIELDRGVLDRMTASFEHLLRNCVTHGIEDAATRIAAGKDPVGTIVVALQHERNEVAVEFRDDGGGLDLARIRDKGVALGLVDADAQPSDAELANLIFHPGFSTAATVTELAGRGVGMDVVRSDVAAMGGRIETATAAGKGTSFKLVLPLTTAVTQIVMLRCGELRVAVPASLVEVVQRATPEQTERAYASGSYELGEHALPFFWLGALLQHSAHGTEGGRTRAVVVIRSAQQRVALHVDEVLGNQEAVVKNLGPQLSGLPGLVGMTLLASGAVALIYNPVALATLYGDSALAMMRSAAGAGAGAPAALEPAAPAAPLVLVVDDSLTVRRVTQRLLVREGYRVVLAKDGLDALERLAEEKPQIVLSDIEMPRMDGFDLVRNMRADARLADLPVIMITSRIAQKHREVAAELGVDHYLGKPYSEEDLLALVGRYTASAAAAAAAGVAA